jgi:hypothetical protein
MKNFTLMAALIAAGSMSVQAQTITSSWVSGPGTSHSYNYTDTHNSVGFGSAGSGQNWNFAAATSDSVYVETTVAPSSAVGASNFPAATSAQVLSEDGIEGGSFFETTASAHRQLGFYATGSGSTASIIYSNPADIFRFPIGLGQSFVDDFAANVDFGILTYQRNGTVSVDVDGSGNLATAAGTFTNVLRVKTVEAYQLIGLPPTPGASTSGTITSYTFISPDYPGIVLYGFSIDDDGITADTSIVFADPGTVGIAPRAASAQLNVYPNPANQQVNISTNNEIISIEVLDIQGRVISTQPVSKNEAIVSVPTSALNNGLYLIRTLSDKGIVTVNRVSVAH